MNCSEVVLLANAKASNSSSLWLRGVSPLSNLNRFVVINPSVNAARLLGDVPEPSFEISNPLKNRKVNITNMEESNGLVFRDAAVIAMTADLTSLSEVASANDSFVVKTVPLSDTPAVLAQILFAVFFLRKSLMHNSGEAGSASTDHP